MFDHKKAIKQLGNGNVAFQDSQINITVSIFDIIKRLGSDGKYNEVADLLKQIKDVIGTSHPLYPHYRYKPVQIGNTIILEHEPRSSLAEKRYPLSYKGRFSIPKEKIEGYNNFDEFFEDIYFKQEEVEINMSSLTTWLGDQFMETPNLDKLLSDSRWVMKPQSLPKPMKLKFYFKDNPEVTIVDYLEMSIRGKEGKDYFIIDNSQQKNSKLLISLKLPIIRKNIVEGEFNKSVGAKINVGIKPEFQENVEANYKILSFFKMISEGKKPIAFKNLEEDKDIIISSNFNFDGNVDELERDFNLIERLYKVENHYQVCFTIPEEFDNEFWEDLQILEHAIENRPIKQKLKKLTVDLTNKEAIRNFVELFESNNNNVQKLMFEQSGPNAHMKILNEIIPIKKVQTIYNSLKIDNLERIKGKLKFMDEGESIRITFLPCNDHEFKEYYYFNI